MSAGYCSNVNLRTEYSKLDKYIDKNAADSIENTSLKACFGSPEYKQLIEERGINDKTSPKKAFEVLKEVLAIKTKNINAINNIGIENSGLFSSKEAKVQAIDYLSANIYLKYKDSVYNGKPATFIETITGLRNNIRQIAAIKMLATSDNADAFKERLKNAKTEAETNIILSDLAEDIKENKIAYNIYAMYKSMYDTDFIRELIDTKNVSNVFTSKDINYEELDSQLDGDFNTEDDLFNDDSDETDKSTLAWNNAIGEKTNFTQHVEELVKLYLMTIPMLNSTDPIITKINGKTKKVWNVKRNSELGLPIYADAQKLMNVLYTNTDNSNCENFIKSIKAVANKKPKLKALAYIADMLESNKDLANKFYMVFNHPVAVKKAAMIDRKGNVDYAQTNSNIFEANVIVDSIVSNIKSATEESIEKAKNILSKDNVSNEDIVDAIKIICPNLDVEEITAYVKDGNHALSRAKMFVNIAYKTIKARAEYNKNVINGRKADADNIVQGFDFIKSFAKEYAEYADVNTSLNHKNVEGKQASDVINNSYLFYVKDMLNSKELSDIYAKQKFIGNDYNHSNILIERVAPTGELMPGLFRYDEVKQEYVITEYANDIFDVSLFDGILNKNNNEGYTYGSMYNGDYLLASLIAYSKRKEIVINTNEGEQVVTVADFFNSIPSDAPKNFVITMPVMSINGLYTNPLIDKTVDDFENKMNTAEINDKPAIHNITVNTSLITSEYTKKIINGDMIETLPIQPNGILAVKKGDNINYRFFVKDEFNIKYEITGTIVKQNNNIYLNDVKLVSIIKDASTSDIVFNSNINVAKTMYKKLVKNEAARDASLNIKTIDINHPIVNAIRNIIYQEILDAYTEARKVFKTDANDNIKFDNLTPVYIDNFNIDSVYGNYGKKGNAVIKKDGAKYKLTGNVYKMAELDSDNAVLNKYYNLLGNDKIFDVLYGRGDSKIVVKDGKLIPNAKQEAAINEAIDEFLHSYLNNATAELRKTYGTFVKNTPIAELGEFLINRFINGVNMDNMFNGKSKYYKNPQTVLKRSKQVQAGGNSFGNTDLTINCLNYGKATNDNPIVVNGRQVIVEGHAISTHNVFTGITIDNTIKYSNNETINMLCEKIDNSDVSEEVKERVLTPFGYVKRDGNTGDKTVVNDAQSYITFDEWIRRIAAAGELHKYASLIEALTNNIPIENIDWSKIPNNIQIQKNFYYDLHRENPNSPEVPRQIKNAEFVLVPKLIKGTELIEIYNAMIANGIDQINTAETSKAAEHNIATLWDVNTGELKLDTFNEKAAIYKQYYSYNHLYRQQEVPEHTIEAKNKAGIQIFKKILDNIPDNDEKGQELKNKLFTYYTAQIKQSFLDIVAELNLPIDKNGNLKVNEDGTIDGLSLKVLLQKAKENAIRQNANRVVIEMFTEAIDGLAKYPLFNNNSGTKIENIINSLFNRGITRQTIAGWHAAQLSDFGFKKLTDKINTTSDGKLKYIQKGTTADGTPIYYAEIRLKRWSNALYKNIKDTNGNIKRIPIPIEEVPEEAKTMIGYRIPTEGKQSIVVMKVVEFLDDAYGSTVVVPDEWVTQSGSDFDVDSIYAMNKTLYQDKNGNVKVNNEDRFTKDEKGYINYVNAYMDRAARTKLKEYNGVLNDTISQIKDIANADREQLNESYKEKILEQINKAFEAANNISELAKDEDSKKRRANLYLIRNAIGRKEKNVKMKVYISNVLENLYALERNEKFMKDEWAVDILKAQYDIYGELQELFDKQVDEISDSYNNTSDNIKQAIEDSNEAKFEISENYAKENGLMSYAQYVSSPVEDRIDSDARNNAIVQTFIDILQQPFAYEENMGRSHFDNVVDSIKKWGELYDNYINGKINNINNNTNQNITNNKINITNSTYTKETPINNPNTNFVFTENAQAYIWANEYYNVKYIFPYKPTLNVSSGKSRTNQAVIRTSPTGELNKNAFGLVVKKYQQNSDGVFVMEEGFFKDTDEDFVLFTTLNKEMFDRLAKDNKPIVFPSSVAMGKAALPKRFADWLQNELKVRFNINSDIKTNGNGYGLELNNVINDTETAIQTHNDLVNDLGGDKIAINEIKDAVKIAKEGLSFDEVLSTVNPVFTKEEITQIKKGLNGKKLQIKSVSRRTDPAFFAKDIIQALELNSHLSLDDPNRINAIELWTKHDGMPIADILKACRKYKVASMVSFSITTLGNTPLEKGVLNYKHLLNLIGELINKGYLDPRTTTIRIDPILPGVTNMEDIKEVVRIGKSLGIRKYVTSLVQSYGYTEGTPNDRRVVSGINSVIDYDWDKYYGRTPDGKIEFKPKKEYIDEIGKVLLEINEDKGIKLETCAFIIKGLKSSACLDPMIIERITGVDITRTDGSYDRDTSRKDCMCYGCHSDIFAINSKQCFSSCAYCYAAHSGDSNFKYYDNNGNLIVNEYTTVNDYNDNSSIAKANNIKDNTNERGNLGGHDFLTQLAWKESAGSGIKIKAISVNLDTGASICNVAKGTLPVSIKVRYDNLNNENVAKSYGNDFDSKTDIVKHNKIGWSNDNKNVVGELITPYSSQTTAHILDVMKSGAIHNENIFTFNSFKLLLNIGVDYDTAIGFLHQPAIDLLVKNWSLTQSVNAEDTSSALWNTISDMAKRIGIDSKGSVDNIIAKYVNQYEARLKERYNSTEPYFYSKYFEERLNGSMSAGEELLHDFETLMLFVELNKQAELFNKTLRVLTSDKFGAKQTFYETDKIFRDIEKLRTAEESSIGGIDKNGNATTLIDAIYPNIENGYNNINVSDSAYPTLAAMLKYASYTSVVVDSTVFDTNKKNFTDIIYNLAKFTRYGNIDKQLYKQYKEYLIHNLYSIDNDNNSVLVNPIVVNSDGTLSVYQSSTGLSNSQVKSDEINRIIGINKTPNAENTFTVGNILRPTEAEIKEFATLSVGQKVLWIKNNITGDTIFDYIDVNMFNEFYVRKGYNPNVEYITSVRGDISDNALFDLFDKCYYSNNLLIKMAAIDLVKYAYIVEGNRYNYNNVSRVITNAPFNDYQDGGLNLGTFIKDAISSYNEVTPDSKYSDELAIGFIRQNMDSFKFKRVSMKKVKSDKILKNVVNVSNNGTITLDLSVDDVRKEAIKLGFGPLIEVKIGNDYKTYMGKTDDSGCLVYVPLEPLAKSDIGIYLEPSNVIHNNNYTSYSEAAKQREINARDINIYASYDAKYNLATAKRYKLPNTKEVANDIANHDFNKHPIYIIKDKFRNTEPIVVENELEGGKAYVVIPVDAKTINNYKTSDLIDDTNKAMITNYANMNFDNTRVVIRETKSDVKFSTIGSEYSEELFNALLETNKVIESANERGDTKAKAVMQKYNKSSINFRNEESVKGNIGAIISANEDFIKTEAYELLNKVNNFMVVDGNNLGINRNEVIEAVFKNDTLENEFIELVLKMVSFKKKYNLIQHIDVDSVDDEIKDSLKTIQSVINNVANNPKIIHAKRKYMNEFIRQNSTNPNVASDLQTAFDIYGDTSQADYLIQDIKFNRNPIIQAFVKESAAIVQEANMRSKQEAMEFENEFNKLVEEARNNGKSISFNKMIKDGRFVNKENQAWHDKHDELWNDYIKAVDETKSTTSIEALKALHKFKTFKYITTVSKFKAIDIPATPTGPATHYQYDNEMLTIERYMLYGTKNDAPELVAKTANYYSKYKELLNQQRDVLSNVIGGILNDEQEQKMNEIYSKINTLVNLYDSDGNKKIGNDYLAAERLAEAIKRIKEVKLVYFDKTVKEGFEIQLKNNLAIIERYEIRDELGNLIVPIAVLMNNEEYKKAKQWIRFNARYILPKDFDENLKKAHAALADSNTKNSVYSTIVREINPRDEYGIIDGTKFSKEQIDKIREDYYKKFDVHGSTNEPYIGIVKTYNPGKYAYNSKFRAEFNNINKAQGTLDDIVRIGMLINNILKKGFDNANRVLHTSSANFTIDDLKTLKLLIEEYHSIRSGVKNKKAAKFISEKCKVVYDESSYNNDRRGLADKSDEYKELWHEIFEEKEIDEITGEVTIKPAMMFYGSIHPKDEYLNDYVDWDKTNAIAFLNEFTREVPTHYYKDTLEAKRKELSPEEFKQWYLDNHVYDPYTRTFKPLRIWLHTEYIDETGNKFKGLWEPRVNQTDSSIKKEFENTEEDGYVEGSINYKEGSYFTDKTTGNKVSTDNEDYKALNEYEIKAIELMKEYINKYAFSRADKSFIQNGYLPSVKYNAKFTSKDALKEAFSFFGFSTNIPSDTKWRPIDDIEFNKDTELNNPMLRKIVDAASAPRKGVPQFPNIGESESDFLVRKQAIIEENKAIDAANVKFHADNINTNWMEVMKAYITNGVKLNASRVIKNKLYFADDALLSNKAKQLNYKNELIIDDDYSEKSEDGLKMYKTVSNTNSSKALRNYIRRIVFNQYKDNSNPKLLAIGNLAQNVAGSKYMMLNVTGGIANFLTGQVNIGMERVAKEYFTTKDYIVGQNIYMSGITSYLQNMFSDTSTSLPDAIIKLANIVDYDRIAELTDKTARGVIKKVRGLSFSPQTMTEHAMQNTVLLAMMKNHKVITDNEGTRIMSREMYMRNADKEALFEVINDELKTKYNDMIESIKKDEARKAKYNMFRNNIVQDFVNMYLTKEQKLEYITKRKEITNKRKAEFDKQAIDVYSQFELSNGYAVLKADAVITLRDFAEFTEKVKAVNKHIHGVYDKIGSALIENQWFGGMVMQFHKHLYPGFKKRYRNKYYYDEQLETIQGASYTSLIRFLKTPIDNINNTDEEAGAIQGIKNYVASLTDFVGNISIYYNVLPENEKANIRRNLADMFYVGAAIVAAIALTAAAGDDDEVEESIWYNLLMYHADRLASEAFAFNPIGLANEGKKLWSSPVAIMSSCNDLLSTMSFAVMTLVDNDFENTYATGHFAGEDKLTVMVERNIPVWRNINRLIELPKNNSYYKVGKTGLSFFPIKDIAHFINPKVDVD